MLSNITSMTKQQGIAELRKEIEIRKAAVARMANQMLTVETDFLFELLVSDTARQEKSIEKLESEIRRLSNQ